MSQPKTPSDRLSTLVKATSKHSDYQNLHPSIGAVVGESYRPAGKKEAERQQHMEGLLDFRDLAVLDIGANTGYFTFGALQAGAAHVTAIEGNTEHANFVEEAGKVLGLGPKLAVRNAYFDFSSEAAERHDLILCLNVLHHLGDDFGDSKISLEDAKIEMARALQNLSKIADTMYFQIGFNWKGNRQAPLFSEGRKAEVIDFVERSCAGFWNVKNISIFNQAVNAYEDCSEQLLKRFDDLGEFLNRPLFLLESVRRGG